MYSNNLLLFTLISDFYFYFLKIDIILIFFFRSCQLKSIPELFTCQFWNRIAFYNILRNLALVHSLFYVAARIYRRVYICFHELFRQIIPKMLMSWISESIFNGFPAIGLYDTIIKVWTTCTIDFCILMLIHSNNGLNTERDVRYLLDSCLQQILIQKEPKKKRKRKIIYKLARGMVNEPHNKVVLVLSKRGPPSSTFLPFTLFIDYFDQSYRFSNLLFISGLF